MRDSRKVEVLKYLTEEPRFRERKNKDRGIINLLTQKRYRKIGDLLADGTLSKEMLTEFVKDYATVDRLWRQSLEENPKLRGADYNEKVFLEQKRQMSLGYMHGHTSDTAKLKTL